jgi:hypothetical protein
MLLGESVMGILSMFSSIIKGVTWAQLANLAMEYGPEIYRTALDRLQPEGKAAAAEAEHELQDRLARLEKLLLEQEAIIKGQAEKTRLLEAACLALESRVTRLKVAAGLLACGCLVLLLIVLR